MARSPTPSELQDRFIVRLPDGMRERIARAAKREGRSMNSEIVSALEVFYPPEPPTEELIAALKTAMLATKLGSPTGKEELLAVLNMVASYLKVPTEERGSD